MQRKIIFIIFISVFTVISCSRKKVFTGDTVIFEFPDVIDTLYSEKIALNDIFTGRMYAYDSLLIFEANFPDNSWWVFNVKTGEHISSIIPKGQGPDEFVMPDCFSQFEVDTNICVWVSDWGTNKFTLIDLTDNTRKKTINLAGINNARFEHFGVHYYLNDSLVLLHNQEELSRSREIIPPIYRIFNYRTKTERVRYEPYNNFTHEAPHLLLSYHSIKPDKSKLAIASLFSHTLIIIDLQSNKINGYRLKNSPGFDDLKEIAENYQYRNMSVDDEFIYCVTSVNEHVMIEVFDWNGTLTRRLSLLNEKTENTMSISLDPVNKILYVLNGEDEEKLYKYDVSYLYAK